MPNWHFKLSFEPVANCDRIGKRKMNKQISSSVDDIGSLIRMIRGQRIILDFDLARIFSVPTFRFNEAVKRNRNRFPSDFLFRLTAAEAKSLRSQFATLKQSGNPSQIAIGSQKHRDPRLFPYAFTENGAIMAANVLNSPEAVRMSVFVVRAFVKMRELLGGTKELARQLADLEKKLTARLDGHEVAIVDVLRRVMDILEPPPLPEPPRRQIGFHAGMEEKPKTKRKKKA
jgi:ORF6N domain